MANVNPKRISFSVEVVIAVIAVISVVLLWVFVPVWIGGEWPKAANDVGDAFGSVNALFAGLAFAGIIATLLLQRKELQQNTDQLAYQAEALKNQVTLMALSAKVSALPILMQQEKERVRSAGGTSYDELLHANWSLEKMDAACIELDQFTAQEKAELEKVKAEQGITTATEEDRIIRLARPQILEQKLNENVRRRENVKRHLRRLKALTIELEAAYEQISQGAITYDSNA